MSETRAHYKQHVCKNEISTNSKFSLNYARENKITTLLPKPNKYQLCPFYLPILRYIKQDIH